MTNSILQAMQKRHRARGKDYTDLFILFYPVLFLIFLTIVLNK